MKTIGIIGGFSPEATAQFYLELMRLNRKIGNPTLPHIIVWNVAVSQQQEEMLLKHATPPSGIKGLLIEAAKQLEAAKAELIVLPCNTLHIFAPEIQKNITVPLIHIVDATARHMKKKHITRVGLLGSGITIKSKMFEKKLAIVWEKPDKALQKQINTALHQSVVKGEALPLRRSLHQAIQVFQQKNIQEVLLACTDFAAACTNHSIIRFHDTLNILAQETIQQSMI